MPRETAQGPPAAARILPTVAAVLALLAVGCDGPGVDPHLTQIQQLQDKVDRHATTIADLQDRLAAASAEIQRLRGLEGDRRLEDLVTVAAIEIDRLSGGYDDDKDGGDEGVAVYLRLRDGEGDVIKAAGSAKVRLYDLARPEGSQLVGSAEIDPATLRGLWYGRFLTSHYTIKVPWADGATRPEHADITVAASFTERLTGRTFETQKVVKVAGVRTAAK